MDYKLSLPYISDVLSFLINIHETIHAIVLDSRIGKCYNEFCEEELLPILYERLFVLLSNNELLQKKYEKYFMLLLQETDTIHLVALKQQVKLEEEYKQNNQLFIKKYSKLILAKK